MELTVHSSVDYGTHTFFAGEVVDAGFDPDYQGSIAAMSDTRMKYGGVKRGGH
jgi:flavin reductase (DIM6/NTAB) family NADH-FMN oxidoreductase RutF